MRLMTGIGCGLSWLRRYRVSLLMIGVVSTVLVTAAGVRGQQPVEAGSAPIQAAAQTTIPQAPVASLATSAALPNIMAVSFEHDPLPLYSQDGGMTWQPVLSTPWNNDAFISSAVAIAPTGNPQTPVRLLVAATSMDQSKIGVYRTGRYGLSWSFTHFDFPDPLCDPSRFVEFAASPADPDRIYLIWSCFYSDGVGSSIDYKVFTSPDAGLTWQPISPYPGEQLWVSMVPSPSIPGRVYGAGGKWYQSEDGGLNWTPKDFPGGYLTLDARDPNLLYEVYPNGTGWRSTDGGKSWVEWAERLPCELLNRDRQPMIAQPKLTQALMARCDEGLFRSLDGGDHWAKLSPWYGQGEHPWFGEGLWVDYGLRRVLWARNDGLWRREGSDWSQLTDSYQAQPLTPWQNTSVPTTVGDVNAIASPASNELWAVGEGGQILHWQGKEWLPVASPTPATLFDIDFISPNEGWVVGGLDIDGDPYDINATYTGIILHWNGNSWTVVPQPTTGALRAVEAISANDAWAVGDGGTILHWNGQQWQTVSSPTTLPLLSIDFVSPTEGWIAGGLVVDVDGIFTGIILRWNGSSWTEIKTTPYLLASIDMLSSSEGWSVGGLVAGGPTGSRMLHWDGVNWQEVPHPTNEVLTEVSMASATEGWAVGSRYYPSDTPMPGLLHWDGQSWKQEEVATDLAEISVETLSANEAWVTGADGRMLRYRTLRDAYLPWIRKN
jgi:photosystem II stability/assembly factor-like uncharacterized protein